VTQKSFSLNKKKIAILGSTGSIGQQCLQIIDQLKDEYQIVLLTAYSNQL
jgi:1-deoxy-D-xylulose-5-phosphate reductoisomerase